MKPAFPRPLYGVASLLLIFPFLHFYSSSSSAAAMATVQPNRLGERCSTEDIVISQGPTAPLPDGIPNFTVEIINMGATGSDISGIHISCGWFSSARLINPKVFKRLGYNDCLVNDGKPLVNGATLYFEYATSFSYPLSVVSVTC